MRRICKVEGCDRRREAQGLCTRHYANARNHGEIGRVRPHGDLPSCAVEGCEGVGVSRGMCPLHYGRWRRYGDPEKTLISHVRYSAADIKELNRHLDSVELSGRMAPKGSIDDLAQVLGRSKTSIARTLHNMRQARKGGQHAAIRHVGTR